MTNQSLGKLESVHGISPVYLQRALIVIILAFIFFLAMLIVFSIRQQVGYFLLATAFLVIKLFTLWGFMQQRKKALILYENGFVLGKKVCLYQDIADTQFAQTSKIIGGTKNDCTIIKKDGEKIVLPEAILNVHQILEKIDEKMAG